MRSQTHSISAILRTLLIRYVIGWPLFFGLIAVVFTLNGALGYVARQTRNVFWISVPLQTLSDMPDALYTMLPISQYFWFELLVRWVLIGLSCYLLLASITSARQRNWSVIAAAFAGLALGMFIITWFTWVIWLVGVVSAIIAFFMDLIAAIVHWLITPPMLYVVIAVVVLFLGFVLFNAFHLRRNKVNWRRTALISMVLVVTGVLLWFSIPVLLGAIAFITVFLIFLLRSLAGLGAVVFLGNQLIDQFRSSVRAGQSAGELFDTSFAFGVNLAIVLLVCYANADYHNLVNEAWSRIVPFLQSTDVVGGAHSFVQPSMRTFLAEVLSGSSLPIFDVVCIIAALFLANCSLLMGSIVGLVPYTWRQIFAFERGLSPILTTIVGAFFTIIFAVIDNASNQD